MLTLPFRTACRPGISGSHWLAPVAVRFGKSLVWKSSGKAALLGAVAGAVVAEPAVDGAVTPGDGDGSDTLGEL
jgi:hypothetical protein